MSHQEYDIYPLVNSFGDSLNTNVTDLTGSLVEVGLDSIMDDGLLKDIPFLSTAISVYRIGHSVKERFCIKKLAIFIDEINKNTVKEERRSKYRLDFQENQDFRNRELEHILVLIDRYVTCDNAIFLAKIYLAYLDGIIDWVTFTQYSEILDRFLYADITALKRIGDENYLSPQDQLLRISALGLVGTVEKMPDFKDEDGVLWVTQEEKHYILTDFGATLKTILFDD